MTEYRNHTLKPWDMDDAGGHYCRHVSAMTTENLHSKADIAEELAWRDMQLAKLRKRMTESESVEVRLRESRALLARMVTYVREDKARTPGFTRLARLTEEVDAYIKRTHDPFEILRGRS